MTAYEAAVRACRSGGCLDHPWPSSDVQHRHCVTCGAEVRVVDDNEGRPVYEIGANEIDLELYCCECPCPTEAVAS